MNIGKHLHVRHVLKRNHFQFWVKSPSEFQTLTRVCRLLYTELLNRNERFDKACVLREIDFQSELETVTLDLFYMCWGTSISHAITWKVFENFGSELSQFSSIFNDVIYCNNSMVWKWCWYQTVSEYNLGKANFVSSSNWVYYSFMILSILSANFSATPASKFNCLWHDCKFKVNWELTRSTIERERWAATWQTHTRITEGNNVKRKRNGGAKEGNRGSGLGCLRKPWILEAPENGQSWTQPTKWDSKCNQGHQPERVGIMKALAQGWASTFAWSRPRNLF